MTLDKYTNLKKIVTAVFEKIKNKKKIKKFSFKYPHLVFRFQPRACCTPSSISSLSFEFRSSETYACKTQFSSYSFQSYIIQKRKKNLLNF